MLVATQVRVEDGLFGVELAAGLAVERAVFDAATRGGCSCRRSRGWGGLRVSALFLFYLGRRGWRGGGGRWGAGSGRRGGDSCRRNLNQSFPTRVDAPAPDVCKRKERASECGE